MLPAAAALLVALALGESKSTARAESRAALDATNAARAKSGLLPRKAPAKAAPVYRSGRRVIPVSGFAPTLLGEPGTLSLAPDPAPPPDDPRRLQVSAHGVTTDVTLSMRLDP